MNAVDKNLIHLGDSFQYMPGMPDKSVDMIFTNPDFQMGKILKKCSIGFDVDMMFSEFNRILKPNGVIVIFAFGIFATDLINANRKNYKYSWIWEKGRTTGFYNAKKQPLKNHEELLVFYNKQCTYNPIMDEEGKYPRTVLNFADITGSKRIYPTQKPIRLISYGVKTYTNPGDVVFDPFCGSGTLAVSCTQEDRRYICIDKKERAIKLTMGRIANEERLNKQKELSAPMF